MDKPKEVSGSPTYPLDIVATTNKENSILTVSVVNPTATDQKVTLNYEGGKIDKDAKMYALIPKTATDENTAASPDIVQVKEAKVKLKPQLSIPPYSIILYEIKLK